MKDAIEVTRVYDHPIEAVWQALTDKEAMSAWLMPCDIEPIVGHRFQFRTKPGPGFNGIVNCEVLEVEAPERLVFSWSGGPLKASKVTFQLRSLGQQTELHFSQAGFKGFFNRLIVKKILSRGWKKKILVQQLPHYLQHG